MLLGYCVKCHECGAVHSAKVLCDCCVVKPTKKVRRQGDVK